jgi:hypothetical protein
MHRPTTDYGPHLLNLPEKLERQVNAPADHQASRQLVDPEPGAALEPD